MKARLLVVMSVVLALVVFSAALSGALEVQPDKDNVVASRLEGKWRIHPALTKRLTGTAKLPRRESPYGYVSFDGDPSVAGKIPAKYDEFLAEKNIYMAGMMNWGGKDYPFILIQVKGNPHVVYFRERDGDPMGDAESFNVILAPARSGANDLLFIGGDFNNQPFSAYERIKKD